MGRVGTDKETPGCDKACEFVPLSRYRTEEQRPWFPSGSCPRTGVVLVREEFYGSPGAAISAVALLGSGLGVSPTVYLKRCRVSCRNKSTAGSSRGERHCTDKAAPGSLSGTRSGRPLSRSLNGKSSGS